MNISKADAIAHLAKWFNAGAQVRATYKTISGKAETLSWTIPNTNRGKFALGVWTDWRNTVAGIDPREIGGLNEGADVKQCRTFNPVSGWSGDQCMTAKESRPYLG